MKKTKKTKKTEWASNKDQAIMTLMALVKLIEKGSSDAKITMEKSGTHISISENDLIRIIEASLDAHDMMK